MMMTTYLSNFCGQKRELLWLVDSTDYNSIFELFLSNRQVDVVAYRRNYYNLRVPVVVLNFLLLHFLRVTTVVLLDYYRPTGNLKT